MNDFQKEVTSFWIRHPEKWASYDLIEGDSTCAATCILPVWFPTCSILHQIYLTSVFYIRNDDTPESLLSWPSLYPPSDTWRKWSKAPSPCCRSNMAPPQQGQKKPWNQFIFWLCWILKPPGLRSGWWARVTCAGCISALLISIFVAFPPSFPLCSLSHILFRLLVPLSMDTTVGPWFSDSWRENTSVWWVMDAVINISQ